MTVAFFDVDETLIREKSMLSFQSYYFARVHDLALPMNEVFSSFAHFNEHFSAVAGTHARVRANRTYYRSFGGRSIDRVCDFCESWFRDRLAIVGDAFWKPEGLNELQRCKRYGKTIVLVSGSFNELLRPVARRLGVDHVLATELVRERGVYTGAINGEPCIGVTKAARVREFATGRNLDLVDCLAVGDHRSDIPMLEVVGRAKVVRGDELLEREALARGWQILSSDDDLPARRRTACAPAPSSLVKP